MEKNITIKDIKKAHDTKAECITVHQVKKVSQELANMKTELAKLKTKGKKDAEAELKTFRESKETLKELQQVQEEIQKEIQKISDIKKQNEEILKKIERERITITELQKTDNDADNLKATVQQLLLTMVPVILKDMNEEAKTHQKQVQTEVAKKHTKAKKKGSCSTR